MADCVQHATARTKRGDHHAEVALGHRQSTCVDQNSPSVTEANGLKLNNGTRLHAGLVNQTRTPRVQLELKQKLVKRTYEQMGVFEEYHRHLKDSL